MVTKKPNRKTFTQTNKVMIAQAATNKLFHGLDHDTIQWTTSNGKEYLNLFVDVYIRPDYSELTKNELSNLIEREILKIWKSLIWRQRFEVLYMSILNLNLEHISSTFILIYLRRYNL